MAEIVLTTLNAKYIHASFGLRYLFANLGDLQGRAALLEFDINQRPVEIAERLLAVRPKIIGLGVYIWNIQLATELAGILKRARPDLLLVLGGPEVSYGADDLPLVRLADYVVTGEADLAFAALCRELLAGGRPEPKVRAAALPSFTDLVLPYHLYDDRDTAHRIIYVEASRGCPFQCEFCLSSLDVPVRQAPLARFLEAIGGLLDRGVRQLKFVDRTFNLDVRAGRAILEFLLRRFQPGHFFHFEMVPDRLPEALRELIVQFPPGALQFEVGIQTFNPEVAARIQRRQDYVRVAENLRFLRSSTGVHIHADLIAGLPGEDLDSFAAGFDRLIALGPHEIQVGILKRLRGTPIGRHDAEWGMAYNPSPPYDILCNRLLDFSTMQKLRRFARFWDLVGNSGNFIESCPRLWLAPGASPFQAFLSWSEWLHGRTGRTDSIALARLMELFLEYLTAGLGQDPAAAAAAIWRDYQRGGRRDRPGFLLPWIPAAGAGQGAARGAAGSLPKRQARHASPIVPDPCANPAAGPAPG